jgi:hypothetical protein
MSDKKITPSNPETLPAQSDADTTAEATDRKTGRLTKRTATRLTKRTKL